MKGLQFTESLTHVEKDKCNIIEGIFQTLTSKFRPQFNKTIKSLQFCKLNSQSGEKCRGMDGQAEINNNRMQLQRNR